MVQICPLTKRFDLRLETSSKETPTHLITSDYCIQEAPRGRRQTGETVTKKRTQHGFHRISPRVRSSRVKKKLKHVSNGWPDL